MDGDQLGFDLGERKRPQGVLFDPNDIRADALDLLAKARAATPEEHWDADTLKYQRIVFPHLVSWLPDAAERAQLTFDFTQALDHIEAMLAA